MVKTITISGVTHTYELTAETEFPHVLVFIHGWLLSREYWQPIIQQLSSQFQCLSYDLRGFGESQPLAAESPSFASLSHSPPETHIEASHFHPTCRDDHSHTDAATRSITLERPTFSSRYAPAAYANDLSHLLKALNIQSAWLVGHSLGGSIALWAAYLCPQQVKGVVCVSSGGGIYLKEEFERFRTAGQQLVRLRPRWLCHVPLVDMMMTRLNVARPISRQWAKRRLIDMVAAHPEAALGTLLDSTTEEEVHRLPQVISRVQQPVHFISGANDDIMQPQYVRHLASFHASFQACGTNVVEIPNCGHLPMIEQPDALTNEISTILSCYTA